MGHRIELGEIEVHVNQMAGIRMSCCVYDKEREKIVLFYVGDAEGKDIIKALKEKLPRYMIPNLVEKIERKTEPDGIKKPVCKFIGERN